MDVDAGTHKRQGDQGTGLRAEQPGHGSTNRKAGGDYGQVYTSTVWIRGSPELCGIRDDPSDPPDSNIANLGTVEFSVSAEVRIQGICVGVRVS